MTKPIEFSREESVFVACMQRGENQFNRELLDALSGILDEVEASDEPAALVITGSGKFFSTGLDLVWLGGDGQAQGGAFIAAIERMFGRLLAFPVPLVAAINGHAFGIGAMLGLACDFRVMRDDRGFFCLPEIDLGAPVTPRLLAFLQARVEPRVLRELLLTGVRHGGAAALERGLVDEVAGEADVLPAAMARAAFLAGKHRDTYAAMKRGLNAEALNRLS